MIVCMLFIGWSNVFLDDETRKAWSTTYWGEAIALTSFGIAWMTAAKLRFLADEKDALKLPAPSVVVQRLMKNSREN